MAIVDYQNPDKVKYFDLEKYVKNIKLNSEILEHLEETNNEFDKYFRYLLSFDSYAVIQYLIDSLNKEIENSQEIENHYIKRKDIENNGVFFETLNITHNRIHDLHNFVMKDEEDEPTFQYRDVPVRVSKMTEKGEIIYWHAPDSEYVKPFMNDFLKIYKQTSTSLVLSNPFLKSALIHLLFVRIHPYKDGNGRTARMIHNIKFTDSINKIHGMRLKICPLNLSASILINKPTYAKRLNSIYFDLENDTNEAINKWFDFILNMVDEQLYYNNNRVHKYVSSMNQIAEMKHGDSSDIIKEIQKMKIKKI